MCQTIEIAKRIKLLAKERKVKISELLGACGLNKNTLSTMTSRGSMPKADTLAKIADRLDCSVDYLLGRTDNPKLYH